MKSQIYFKIKNEKNYDSIRFTGGSLSLKDLKTKIKEKLQDKNAGIGKEKDKDKAKDDILVIDELTKQLISDDSTAIASDRKVLIERSSALPLLGATGYRSYAAGIKADKSEFMCPLCKNQFVNPTLTRCCGGTACETCIDKSVKQKNECPFCHKKALGSIKAGPNKSLQDLIHKQSTPMPPVLPMAYGGSQPMNPNVAMNSVPFKEVDKYLNGAKYFIIKSSNFENIQLSIKHSEWATTKANETKLNNAFQRSKNVILIFSVNKSSQFQGYARMESLSTNRAASWQVQDSIKLGGSFKILWLRVCNVNFSRVSQMKNKFNNGEPIKKSRDTQEIPEDIGFQICNMFELPDKDNSTTMHYPTSSERPKFMYQYGGIPTSMGYPGPDYTAASSPRDMREFKPLSSDTASPNDGKSPISKLASDDFQSNVEREDYYVEEEKKKDEPEIDLLADLDFDEPTNFESAPEPKIQNESAPVPTEKPAEQHLMEGIDLDDFPLEHEVANLDEIVEELDAEVAPEIEIEPEAEAPVEDNNVAKSEAKESIQQEQEHDEDQDDFLHNLESFEESDKIQEEEPEYEQHHKPQEEDRPHPPPPKMHYEAEKKDSSPKSPSSEKQAEEKKKPKPPTVDMHKFPPTPNMPYDASSMIAQGGSYMPRPPPVMDHRPPPPNMMYPSAPQSMRYQQQQYGSYPNQYQNTPYGSYPMAPYPGMDQRMQMGGMNPNYPYQYYGYPGMWGGQNTGGRPFQMDSRGRPEGAENDGDNHSEGSEESDSSRKREKKKHKKEKKKKRSRDRSKDRSREREKSNVREKGRSRDRSREKSRNKSKSKSRRK